MEHKIKNLRKKVGLEKPESVKTWVERDLALCSPPSREMTSLALEPGSQGKKGPQRPTDDAPCR